MSLLADEDGIAIRNPIKKIASGTYFSSYVITGTLSDRQSLYRHANQGLAKIFRNWFPNESAFKSFKVMAKQFSQFKRLDVYGNPIGTIPEDSATSHPAITEGDRTNGSTPDNQRRMDITGNNHDGIIYEPCPNNVFPNPSDDDSSSSQNLRQRHRKERKHNDFSLLTQTMNELAEQVRSLTKANSEQSCQLMRLEEKLNPISRDPTSITRKSKSSISNASSNVPSSSSSSNSANSIIPIPSTNIHSTIGNTNAYGASNVLAYRPTSFIDGIETEVLHSITAMPVYS